MLTKLNDLNDQRSVVFVIATNYYERIDRAIKRAGRIDARYLVLPPSATQRKRHLQQQVHSWDSLDKDQQNEIVTSTVRYTYRELDDVVMRAKGAEPASAGELLLALKAAVATDGPMAAPDAYVARLEYVDPSRPTAGTEAGSIDRPLEELALLAYLDFEVGEYMSPEPAVVRAGVEEAIERGDVRDAEIIDALQQALEGTASASSPGRAKIEGTPENG